MPALSGCVEKLYSIVYGETSVGSVLCGDTFFCLSDPLLPDCHEHNSLLLALCQSEQSHSFCAGSIKAHLLESRIGGVVEQLYLLCSCLQLSAGFVCMLL